MILEVYNRDHFVKKNGGYKKNLKVFQQDITKVLAMDISSRDLFDKENFIPIRPFVNGKIQHFI